MAEGGSPNDNPFSFQSFMKKKDDRPNESRHKTGGEEVADIFDLPDISSSTQRRAANDEDQKPRAKSEKKDKNPFSFKKFIAGGGARPKTKSGPDVASDLPDCITGHLNEETSPKHSRSSPHTVLPDFALYSSPDVQPSTHYDSVLPQNSSPHRECFSDINISDSNYTYINGHCKTSMLHDDIVLDGELPIAGPHLVSTLPDLMSDTAGISNDIANPKSVHKGFLHYRDVDCNSSDVNSDQSRTENQELREMLAVSQQENSTLTKRLAQKCKELEELRAHEAEESKALENMVQQVEANLVTTTKRAVQAEATVAKLKQEIRSLQNQLSVITIENEDLRCGNTTITSIKERTQYASSTLSKAASNAEQQLKDMLSGVESLKMLAEVLASIDKIREPSPQPSTSAGAEGGQL